MAPNGSSETPGAVKSLDASAQFVAANTSRLAGARSTDGHAQKVKKVL